MRTRAQSILFFTVAAICGWTITSSPAHAELNACGGIFLSSDANCGYKPKKECMTECMTVAVEESCVVEVYNECSTECTTTASTECQASCTTSCVDNCTTTVTTEEKPSCRDLCLADCESDGDKCGGSSRRGACGRCEKHNCDKKCEARCGDDPEPAKVTTVTECMPTCTNACMASCTAKVNTQCQVDCQERVYTSCEQKMVEHCETECTDKGGAIFCDGQFVNAVDANDCASELKAEIKIDIDIEGTLKAAGEGIEDAADDVSDAVDENVDVETKCSVTNAGSSGDSSAALVGIPVVALALWRMRRRTAKQSR